MKQIWISCLVVLLAGCATSGGYRSLDARSRDQILQDMNAVDVIVIAELLEAEVAGNYPIAEEGADVKKEVAIDKRVYTRGEIELRGIVRGFLKGRCPSNLIKGSTSNLVSLSNLISFNIPTPSLVSNRHGELLRVPASNIPDLKIGETYILMLDPTDSSNLYFTCIWPVGSPAARFVQDQLKTNRASNTASHGTGYARP